MASRRVLVTGLGGFTGHYVHRELANAGWDVWGIGNTAPEAADGQFVMANLADRTAVHAAVTQIRPDAVLHLAAVSFVGHGRIDDFYTINLLGTRYLLEALAENNLARHGVVLASSANIYGNAATLPLHEDTPPAPANDYAVAKLAMEHMARLFLSRLRIVIARPFNYTGHGQDPKFLVPKIVAHFRDRAATIELGNLDVARDFSDVRDVTRTYRLLLETMPSGETLNICSGRAVRLGDVLDQCRDITGHKIDVTINPEFVRDQDVKILMGDTTRLDSLVADVPRRPLQETLAWMLGDDTAP